jgi:hypothetical protein
MPGYAPAVSTKLITGRPKRSAVSMIRAALRYPSGRAMPKLCRTRVSVVDPFSWPMIATASPAEPSEPGEDGFVLAELAVARERREFVMSSRE